MRDRKTWAASLTMPSQSGLQALAPAGIGGHLCSCISGISKLTRKGEACLGVQLGKLNYTLMHRLRNPLCPFSLVSQAPTE